MCQDSWYEENKRFTFRCVYKIECNIWHDWQCYKISFCVDLVEEDANFKHCPSRDEWNRVERISWFLKPFNDITTLFSKTDPTTNLYFQGGSQIELLLLEEMESQDSFISNMAEQMKGKFDKYWDCYSVVLACAIVLNPRYKLDYVDFTFKKIEPIEHIAEMKVESVQTTLYKVFFRIWMPQAYGHYNCIILCWEF